MADKDSGATSDIIFDKTIYKVSAIKKSAAAYAEFASFKVIPGKDKIRVAISGADPEQIRALRGEFCNYALFLMKEA